MIRRHDFVDDPARQCRGKRSFASKGEAKLAIKRIQTVAGQTRQVNVAYRCPHCGWFHYGRKPGTSER